MWAGWAMVIDRPAALGCRQRRQGTIVSVLVLMASGGNIQSDDEGEDSAYVVLDSGVLQVLVREDKEWRVDVEISPAAWERVSGTRFIDPTKDIPGSDGQDGLRTVSAYEARGITVV